MTAPTVAFATEWQQWHDEHGRRRADRHGFLAITSINWLGPEPQRFPDAPGTWSTGPDGIVVDLGDEIVTVDGDEVTGRYEIGVIPERGGLNLAWAGAVVEVARREGNDIVRPRHPDAETLTRYRGTDAYPPDPSRAVAARFVRYAEPRPTTVDAVVDDLLHVYDAPGEVRFTLDGVDHTLVAFPGSTPGTLMVLFTDGTSGVTTYAANRVVAFDDPGTDGEVTLDFNRAVNLPCASTTFATCSLPPAKNHLSV